MSNSEQELSGAEAARRLTVYGPNEPAPPAIQDFGSIDILCSDKTGTLTGGVMQFDRSVDPVGAASPRALALAFINSSFETGIRSPLDQAILQQAAVDVAGPSRRRVRSRHSTRRRRGRLVPQSTST